MTVCKSGLTVRRNVADRENESNAHKDAFFWSETDKSRFFEFYSGKRVSGLTKNPYICTPNYDTTGEVDEYRTGIHNDIHIDNYDVIPGIAFRQVRVFFCIYETFIYNDTDLRNEKRDVNP